MKLDLKMVQEFEDFLNMPQPGRDIEPMEVRDYRHEAYRKFEPLISAIMAQTKAPGLPDLRDWFAGQALAGIGTWCPSRDGEPPADKYERRQRQAQWAYEMADAMLVARMVPELPVRRNPAQ